MPLYKYKSFAEAERASWHFQADADYLERIRALWEFADQLSQNRIPARGVQVS